MQLTDTQHAILALIAERIQTEGLPPSQTEIARALGFRSVRAAQYHLEALEAAGAIERLPGRARGLRLKQVPPAMQASLPLASAPDDAIVRLAILGRVAAGAPIGSGADAHDGDAIVLDRSLFHPSPDYLLRVEGDSMRGEGILDGDLVGVHRTSQARNGQIVVARVDEEITIKVLEHTRDGIRLLPCNAGYEPIQVPPDADFALEGLYCGLVRPRR
ncbi:transcriptional repressor LexA [Xanthomonadaceae bacterium JHOS43]|nr:transcriptional repressor LexA [Xanthomonadaceae bacterium JHOS43]MCX7562829.1 transcriptional repressor LexA [Xanthomonadaceae bacterium XH05]